MDNWNSKKALDKWLQRNYKPFRNQPLDVNKSTIHFYKEGEYIPITEWETALIKAAQLVEELGADYIGIFERAERELKQAKQNLNTLERIRKINQNQQSLEFKSNFVKPKSFLFQSWTRAISGTSIFMPH